MSKGNHRNYWDRLELLIAIMTGDYEKALKVGSSVLKQTPNDLDVLQILSAVRDKIAVNSLAESADDNHDDNDEDDDDNDSKESISDSEDTRTDCETSDDLDTDTDTENEEKESEDDDETQDDRIIIDSEKCPQTCEPAKDSSELARTSLLSFTDQSLNPSSYSFKEKMYRILALKTNNGKPIPL